MEWLPNEKTREMDRLYRQFLLAVLLIASFIVIVAYFIFPQDARREPVKTAVLFVICVGVGLSIAFWGRSRVKKSGIPGGELIAYWSKKPLSRVIQLIILIGVVINIYRVVKGK